ncbi:MAG: hypothetical protein IJ247_07395 [Bacilli bacterium]|nr:hypothetical protein [Bacilli bacterium]
MKGNKHLRLLAMMFLPFSLAMSIIHPPAIEAKAESIPTLEVFGMQIRGDSGSGHYFVIQSTVYTSVPETAIADEFDSADNIYLFLGGDEEGIPLSSALESRNLTMNKWGSEGLMYKLSEDYFARYNGTTIERVVINPTAYFPTPSGKAMIDFTLTGYNQGFGVDSAKEQSFHFTFKRTPRRMEEKISLFTVEVRGVEGGDETYLSLSSLSYTDVSPIEYTEFEEMNTFSKIKVYLSSEDEGKTLGEITHYRSAIQNKWVSRAFMLTLGYEAYKTYNGASVYRIDVEEGCEVYLNGNIYEIDKDYSFVNADYGDESAIYEAFNFVPRPLDLGETLEVATVQVRGDQPGGLFYLSIVSGVYFETEVQEYTMASFLNTYSSIRVYLSPEDEGKTLGEITSYRKAVQNLWTSTALLFELGEEAYDTYNGTTVYKIEIDEGCELYLDGRIIRVNADYRFVNGDYGNEDAKYEAFNFVPEADELKSFGSIELMGVHNREHRESGTRWLMLLFSSFVFENTIVANTFIDELNFLDNVKISSSEDGSDTYPLRDIYTGDAITMRQFGEANMLGITISDEMDGDHHRYDGASMYKITIEKGTEIPSNEGGELGYRTVEEKTFLLNDEYGLRGEIPDVYDEYGNNRLYEEWNLSWSLAYFASFQVVGIEGLSFPDMMIKPGEFVSLSRFAVDGYDLTVTTSEGDKVYQNIIGVSRFVEYILTYTESEKKDEEEAKHSNGCSGSLIASSILTFAALGAALALLKARKEGE